MKRSLYTSFVLFLLAAFSIAEVVRQDVPIKLGAKAFREGDVVSISKVTSTSEKMEVGDTVTVKGKYRLDSVDSANLLLTVTRLKSDKAVEIDKIQMIKAAKGWHEFELSIIIKHKGIPHLTFYDIAGKPFGGVYFGGVEQFDELKKMSVSHYKK